MKAINEYRKYNSHLKYTKDASPWMPGLRSTDGYLNTLNAQAGGGSTVKLPRIPQVGNRRADLNESSSLGGLLKIDSLQSLNTGYRYKYNTSIITSFNI